MALDEPSRLLYAFARGGIAASWKNKDETCGVREETGLSPAPSVK
tara:strand:+ start:364 stop:498 length:135 start_codon:yes stop_codon:yes gene_type:complete